MKKPKRYVYVVEFYQLDRRENKFRSYRREHYSSWNIAVDAINEVIRTNQGYDRDQTYRFEERHLTVTYLSKANTEHQVMKLRITLDRYEIKTY